MEFSEPITAGNNKYYFATCSSDINIKFNYSQHVVSSGDFHYYTFNDASCAPTNIKIIGNYSFTTRSASTDFFLLGLSFST